MKPTIKLSRKNKNFHVSTGGGEGIFLDNERIMTSSTVSNPNLFINGDFRVNQRGETTYTSSSKYSYTVDRFRVVGVGSVGVSESGLDCVLTSQYANLSYIFEDSDSAKFAGKQVTLSFSVENLIGSLTIKIRQLATNITLKTFTTNGLHYMTVTLPNSLENFDIHFENNNTTETSFRLNWAKLELGGIATPISPRNYAEELLLCQRYYLKVIDSSYKSTGCGFISTETRAFIMVSTPTTLRTKPTVSWSQLTLLVKSGAYKVLTSLAVSCFVSNAITINVEATGLTAGDCGLIATSGAVGKLAFDAEIY